MRRFYFFVFSVLITCCLFACQKDGSNSVLPKGAQSLILGQWDLQQQKLVQYVDGVKTKDTSYLSSTNNVARVEFKSNGTFSSTSFYTDGNSTLGQGAAASGSTAGTYSFAGGIFDISAPVQGLNSFGGGFSSTTVAVITAVSHSSKLNQITSSKLSLHVEYMYTSTVDGVSKNYKTENDYFYTR